MLFFSHINDTIRLCCVCFVNHKRSAFLPNDTDAAGFNTKCVILIEKQWVPLTVCKLDMKKSLKRTIHVK